MKKPCLGGKRQAILGSLGRAVGLFTLSILILVGAFTPGAARPSRGDGQPALIDRELFFGDPEITGGQISPDGKFIAFIKPYKGTRNVWVKRTSEPFNAARAITNDTARPIRVYFWSRDGKYILFAQDKGGDENFNVYAVDPAATPAGQEVPTARNLTDLKGVRAELFAVPKVDPDILYVGINDRDKAWHDLYKVKISTGERTLLRKNTDRITGWVFDQKGQLRLATRAADNGDTEILRVDDEGFKKIYSCNVFESCGPDRFHKDGRRFYMETNKGDATDLIRLVLFDPQTGKEEAVESDPAGRVDLGDVTFSDLTDELISTTYEDDRTRVYWKNKAFEADYDLLKKRLPGKEIGFGSSTRDEQLFLIIASSDTEPGETYLFDQQTKKLELQYRIREKLPRESLAAMKSVRYKSSDGLEIPAYLTLPKGVSAKNLPAIVFPHGGPWGRDSWGYNGYAQFLANRGYAVLQPNFRSSTGYGKKFLNAGNLEWGQKMQDDLTWGAKYLVAEGIADSKHIGIMGGSYGGYATLAGVAFTPDLYAGAVDIVGPSNLITLLDSIPPYWEAGRKVFMKRMGDPSTPEGRVQLERQSPLNSANKIKTPLLVVQGANDPRVNKAEADQIVVALRDRGFPVEYIVAPDEGHGFARPVNNMAMFAAAEKFLAKHLGGRYQEGATPEVSARLNEITVDIKTVKVMRKIDSSAVGTPKPATDLKAGTTNYEAKLEIGGQSIPLSITSTITEDGGSWSILETLKTPQGDATDATHVDKGSLVVTRREIKQGPLSVDVEFKVDKATGTMTMNGKSKPIAQEIGGALYADGAGAYEAMAALPLAEGYATTFRNFDIQKQKIKLMQLKVVGTEKVSGPAGAIDAFKIEVSSADGGADKSTVWVGRDSRKVLKVSAILPEMGGAVLTIEPGH